MTKYKNRVISTTKNFKNNTQMELESFLNQNVLSSHLIKEDKVARVKAFISSWVSIKTLKTPEEIKFLDLLQYAYNPESLPLGRRENPFHQEIMTMLKDISENQGFPDFAKTFYRCSVPDWKLNE